MWFLIRGGTFFFSCLIRKGSQRLLSEIGERQVNLQCVINWCNLCGGQRFGNGCGKPEMLTHLTQLWSSQVKDLPFSQTHPRDILSYVQHDVSQGSCSMYCLSDVTGAPQGLRAGQGKALNTDSELRTDWWSKYQCRCVQWVIPLASELVRLAYCEVSNSYVMVLNTGNNAKYYISIKYFVLLSWRY